MPSSNGHESVLPPHSREAEQSVLGCILIDPDAFYQVDAILNPDDFFIGAHREIYNSMRLSFDEGFAVDLVTLSNLLDAKGITNVASVPMEVYLMELVSTVPTSINAVDYSRIVEALSIRRKLLRAGSKISTLATENDRAISKILGDAESELYKVTDRLATKGITDSKTGMTQLFDVVQQRQQESGQFIGLPTGFRDLDLLLRGLRGGRLYTLAARPGMGKSILKSEIIRHNAKHGKIISQFDLEMVAENVNMRMLAAETSIPFTRIDEGKLTDVEFSRLSEAIGRMSGWHVWTDDTPSLTMSQLAAKARRIYAEYGLDLITVDYMQLMSVDKSYGNRVQDVGQISRGLKRLSIELNVPVIAVAQLSRACEQRQDKRPMLSDLRDSGEIEQDSDVVMFLYRDEYYRPDETERPGIAEVNVAKNRHGKTGHIDLFFKGDVMSFGGMAPERMRL